MKADLDSDALRRFATLNQPFPALLTNPLKYRHQQFLRLNFNCNRSKYQASISTSLTWKLLVYL